MIADIWATVWDAFCLRMRDLVGNDQFTLTQERMAQMIGARRNSVSIAAHT